MSGSNEEEDDFHVLRRTLVRTVIIPHEVLVQCLDAHLADDYYDFYGNDEGQGTWSSQANSSTGKMEMTYTTTTHGKLYTWSERVRRDAMKRKKREEKREKEKEEKEKEEREEKERAKKRQKAEAPPAE